jgi:UDPglucose 6-dehydrogenase
MKKVAMIGCGKLGLPCAEVMATKNDVVGVDVQEFTSNSVKPVSIEQAMSHADIIFIAAPTPHEEGYGGEGPSMHLDPKDFDYTIVSSILENVNALSRPEQLVVLISTVLPGTVRNKLRKILSVPRFIYNPYLIAMGSVAWDMVNPEMVIIGTENGDKTTDAAELISFYRELMQNNPRYEVGTWEEAEGIKIFYNTFISAKIGLVNMMQDIAEKIGHMNVDVITDALSKSTHRITGPAYMRAGMGDAGACHPRDNIALRELANRLDIGYDMFHTIMYSREVQAKNLALKMIKLAVEEGLEEIWIHGKAYKPHVPYTTGSYSLLVGYFINAEGWDVKYIDPLTGDVHDSVKGVILLAHHAPTTYGNVGTHLASEQSTYCSVLPGSVIVDPWRKSSQDQFPGCRIVHYGNTRPNENR